MAFKVNYNQQRAERDRVKAARKIEKQKEREEEVARRKAAGLPPADETTSADETTKEGGAHGPAEA